MKFFFTIVLAILFINSNAQNTDFKLRSKVTNAMLSMQRASWEQGVAAQAFLELGDEEMTYLMAKEAVLRQTKEGRLSVLYSDGGSLDPACSGEAVWVAYQKSGDTDLKLAAEKMLAFLKEKAPRNDEGILYHQMNGREFWSDAMYMAPPFLAAMGEYSEAVKQIEGFRKYLCSPDKHLFAHRWSDKESRLVDAHLWGGGNGWAAACYSRVILALPASMEMEKQKLISYHKELLDACISYMRNDGLFHDFIDEPESFVETNLGQMLAYSIYKGIKGGWLDHSYKKAADKMRKAAISKVDNNGIVTDACGAPWFNSPGRSTEAQAFFLLMEAAYDDLENK
ncbi:glycoside hydrolase family 88 protein [Sunxiuqinia sp. A32]|uniref:glycoside hydrolase family 88 protein n=1 Tax=Sunxiuqinia sp. A32 TaxID=3461496 RepID=UPI0040459600